MQSKQCFHTIPSDLNTNAQQYKRGEPDKHIQRGLSQQARQPFRKAVRQVDGHSQQRWSNESNCDADKAILPGDLVCAQRDSD